MRRTGTGLLCAAAGLGLGGCGAGALQTAHAPSDVRPEQGTVIFDCAGRGQVRPTTIPLFCADDGATVTQVRWSRWGGAEATASGGLTENLCVPDCAAGHYVRRHIRLIADGLSLQGTAAAYSALRLVTLGRPREGAETFSLTINGPVLR